MTTRHTWTDREQQIVCAAYAVLLDAQNNSVTTNKAALRRATLAHMNAGSATPRSAGSYEFKMCNISAALDDAGNDYVTGYKPRSGYQRSLLDILCFNRPDLVPYSRCDTCDDLMNYNADRHPRCALCITEGIAR